MQLNIKIIFAMWILLLSTIFSYSSYATWPTFLPPEAEFLLNNNYIDTRECPPGQGKLKPNLILNIHQDFCKTYCPDTWTWIGNRNDGCHALSTDFTFQGYDITHYNDANGVTSHSIVTAFFGKKDSQKHFFQFVFTSPDEHWYCLEMNPILHTVICANDI